MITVVVADDQALLRGGVRIVLESEPDIAVVGEAADGRQALDLVRELRPAVLLLDVRMPVLDGLGVLAALAGDPGTRVVVLTTFDLDEYVYAALRAGAAGFLLKDAEPAELLQAVRVAARGDALLAPAVTRRLIAMFAGAAAPSLARIADDRALGVLTEREREVVALAAYGLSNDEIADRLRVSPATARTHVSRAMVKLNARDRAQLVVFAYRSGLVRPDA
ncbi:response regulator transcription factor [Dactylosporangium darangshiense]|uniref:response regulator transcription factor n=1 Tax=Dactylosporangium darangshiense TaxID=579108 RepID=UPI0031F06B2A